MKRTANAWQTFSGRGLRLSAVLLIGLLLAVSSTANAQAMLGARNSATHALRMKSLDVNVSIRGSFAQTQVQMIFQNELSEQTEADFEYVVPDNSVVTHFAYWFKDEKVVARVVEKERALAIYRAITVRRRDPALIERINKNKFRARIFPIEPNADLKVEMRWVQVLTSDAKGTFYKFPLRSQEEGKGTLENLNVRVRAVPDASVSKVVNNYKLTPKVEDKAQVLQLTEKNYRPSQDFLLRFERPARALHASLYAAPSGGRDGFFALALTPNQNLKNPRITFSGVSTYHVLPARLSNLRAHQTFIVVGRYRPTAGNKSAGMTLSGFGRNTARQSLSFSGQREDNNLASKLWAAAQIEALSPNDKAAEKNRERLIALSTRFTLPSSVTSWLAVPKAEWENFKRLIAQDDKERIGPQLAKLSKQGKLKSTTGRRLRAQFNSACKILGENPAQELSSYLGAEQRERYYRLQNQRNDAANRLALAVARGQNSKAAKEQREVMRLNRYLGAKAHEGIAESHNNLTHEIIYQLANVKAKLRLDVERARQLENSLKRLAPKSSLDIKQLQKDAYDSHMAAPFARYAVEITQEILDGHPNSEKVKALEREAAILGARVGLDSQAKLQESIHLHATDRAQNLAIQLVKEENEYKIDQEKIRSLQTKVERLESANVNKNQVLKIAEGYWASSTHSLGQRWLNAQHGPNASVEEAQHWRLKLEKAVAIYNQEQAKKQWGHKRSVDEVLATTEYLRYQWKVQELRNNRAAEVELRNSDTQKLQRIDDELEKIMECLTPLTRERLSAKSSKVTSWGMRELLLTEYRKNAPNPARTAEIEEKFIGSQNDHYFVRTKTNDPKFYGQLRVQRLKARTQQELLAEKLQKENATLSPEEKKRLSANRAQLAKREKELVVRMGDPLIQVQAPADAQQVVAVFPGGEIKQMVFNTDSQQWEARFDVPTYAVEGAYTVSVVVVFKDGTRKHLTMRFHVDVTAPDGVGKALLIDKDGAKLLRLELDADEDTARVLAILPGNQKVELSPSTQQENRFFALAPLKNEGQQALELKSLNVVFILTDRAHNRTTVTVDMSQ